MSAPAPSPTGHVDDATLLEQAVFEVRKVIVGQRHLVERLLVALLAEGHVLVEGPPGVAKTLAAETLAKVVGGEPVPARIVLMSDGETTSGIPN
jgi:MoxR-like ATPase